MTEILKKLLQMNNTSFEYIIQIQDLVKKFSNATNNAVDHLDFEIKKGIITGLLGPNGAGKTTTISILFGLTKQDSGSAKILGLDNINDYNEIRTQVGVVPQHIALFPQLTGIENLQYFGALYKIPKKELQIRIEHFLDIFGLSQHANKKVENYSGGMKRRANIIAGILHMPKVLILDEPTAGVDIHSRSLILDFLKQYNQEGHSIVYTSHLLEEAERLCNEVIIMDNGKKIVQQNTISLIENTAQCKNLEDVFLHYTGKALREF